MSDDDLEELERIEASTTARVNERVRPDYTAKSREERLRLKTLLRRTRLQRIFGGLKSHASRRGGGVRYG